MSKQAIDHLKKELNRMGAAYTPNVGWFFRAQAGILIPETATKDAVTFRNYLIQELDKAKMMLNHKFDEKIKEIREV